jgi:hypothetical protein
VILWSADALSSIIKVDNDMIVKAADDGLALMIGRDLRRLLKQSLARSVKAAFQEGLAMALSEVTCVSL